MAKYIDAEKLITEIERQMNECIGRFGEIHKLPEYRCLKNIHSYITSLQQEQLVVEGWIARDKDGMLRMHGEKPRRSRNLWVSSGASHDVSEFFPDDFITWEEEPLAAEFVIRNARKEK